MDGLADSRRDPARLSRFRLSGSATNKLRLYSALASDSFNIHIFNRGDYIKAVSEKIASENISKILYPADEALTGKELRLTQEYFLVACTLRDVLADYAKEEAPIAALPERVAIQLNDTHPALAVAELMRLLVDEHQLPWEQAGTSRSEPAPSPITR